MDPSQERIRRLERLAHLDLDDAERRILADRLERLLATTSILDRVEPALPATGEGTCPLRDDRPTACLGDDPLAGAVRDAGGLVETPPPSGRSSRHD